LAIVLPDASGSKTGNRDRFLLRVLQILYDGKQPTGLHAATTQKIITEDTPGVVLSFFKLTSIV